MKKRRLSEAFAAKDVLLEVSNLIKQSIAAQNVVSCASVTAYGGNGRYTPDPLVCGCDKFLEPDRHGYSPYWNLAENAEVCQHWIVTDDLAGRLAEQGEVILLVADEFYVWCRTGCGYAIEDDLRFLDEEPVDELDPSDC